MARQGPGYCCWNSRLRDSDAQRQLGSGCHHRHMADAAAPYKLPPSPARHVFTGPVHRRHHHDVGVQRPHRGDRIHPDLRRATGGQVPDGCPLGAPCTGRLEIGSHSMGMHRLLERRPRSRTTTTQTAKTTTAPRLPARSLGRDYGRQDALVVGILFGRGTQASLSILRAVTSHDGKTKELSFYRSIIPSGATRDAPAFQTGSNV